MATTTHTNFDSTKSINANFVKKNRRPPNAGKGRKKGVPNVITKTMREFIHEFLTFNAPKVQEDYEKLRKKDYYKALQVYQNFMEYDTPKLARSEVVHSGDPLITPIVTNAVEASAVYIAMLGNPQFDSTKIRYESVVAEQGQTP